MPRALVLETSGRTGSIALVDGDSVVAAEAFSSGLKHAALLLPTINALVLARGWTPSDIEQIYVAIGPGSFTGLRIGVTLAKTLAWTTGAKIVAVPSHRVLVENCPSDATEAITVLDAKRGQVFTSRFTRRPGAAWAEIEPAHVESLAAMLSRAGRPVWLIGNGIPFHAAVVPTGEDVIVTDESSWHCRAEVVATLGMTAAARGDFTDAGRLEPLYIRLAEAEEKRLAALAVRP